MAARRSPLGFTLVELLVVIALVAALMGLLLPATQAARERARQTKCSNNLKQIALACAGHVQSMETFPSAGWGWGDAPDPDAGFHDKQPGGWLYNILDFADESAVRQLGAGLTGAAKQSAVRKAVETPIPLYFCPTRGGPSTMPFTHGGCFAGIERPAVIAPTHYAGNAGTGPGGALGTGDSSWGDTTWRTQQGYPHRVQGINDSSYVTGVIAILGRVRTAHVSDGASQTFLAGERYMNPDFYLGPQYCANDQGWTVGFDYDTVAHTGNTSGTTYSPAQDTPGLGGCHMNFGSAHVGVFTMAFCDGAVRTMGYEVDPVVFRGLGSRNGRELVTPP